MVLGLVYGKSAKDILGTVGPGLVGGTLFYIILTLSFPAFDDFIFVTTVSFVLSLLLNIITPAFMERFIVTSRVRKNTVKKLKDYYKEKYQGSQDNSEFKEFLELVDDKFKKSTEVELRRLKKTISLAKEENGKDSEDGSVSNGKYIPITSKEIKIQNYISVVIILLVVVILPIILYPHSLFTPLVKNSQNPVIPLDTSIYTPILVISVAVLFLLALGILVESRKLDEMYIDHLDFLLLRDQDYSDRFLRDIEGLKNERRVLVDKVADRGLPILESLIRKKEQLLDEQVRRITAQKPILLEVSDALYSDDKYIASRNELLGLIGDEFPIIRSKSVLKNTEHLLWREEISLGEDAVKKALEDLISGQPTLVEQLLTDPQVHAMVRIIGLSLYIDRQYTPAVSVIHEILTTTFDKTSTKPAKELCLVWVRDLPDGVDYESDFSPLVTRLEGAIGTLLSDDSVVTDIYSKLFVNTLLTISIKGKKVLDHQRLTSLFYASVVDKNVPSDEYSRIEKTISSDDNLGLMREYVNSIPNNKATNVANSWVSALLDKIKGFPEIDDKVWYLVHIARFITEKFDVGNTLLSQIQNTEGVVYSIIQRLIVIRNAFYRDQRHGILNSIHSWNNNWENQLKIISLYYLPNRDELINEFEKSSEPEDLRELPIDVSPLRYRERTDAAYHNLN